MPDVKFLAVLPNIANASTRVTKLTISGTLLQEPQQFSVNFVNTPFCTDNITYHFKVDIKDKKIVENFKRNGEWNSLQKKSDLDIFDESIFRLEFTFDYTSSVIHVHKGAGYNLKSKYDTLFSLSEIQSIQVWGDVQKVRQFALSYIDPGTDQSPR